MLQNSNNKNNIKYEIVFIILIVYGENIKRNVFGTHYFDDKNSRLKKQTNVLWLTS